jgi:hypothetical protein
MPSYPKLLPLLPVIVPIATAWVRGGEREALREGQPLNPGQLADARAVGIAAPERVRLLKVPAVPTLRHPVLRPLAWLTRRVFPDTAGITFRYGILIRNDCWGDRHLLVHELAHVAQYERLGGIAPFLRAYLRECLAEGYPFGPLEQEAIVVAANHQYGRHGEATDFP